MTPVDTQAAVWEHRIRNVQQTYPTVTSDLTSADTRRVVNGEELLSRLLRAVLAVDNVMVRRGQRPDPDVDEGRRLLAELRGQDFTVSAFPVAFRILAGDRSLENLARRTNMSRSNLCRLLNGTKTPRVDEIVTIAEAFNKRPTFFAEYRTMVISAIVAERLAADPDRSAVIAHQIGLGR